MEQRLEENLCSLVHVKSYTKWIEIGGLCRYLIMKEEGKVAIFSVILHPYSLRKAGFADVL